MTSKDLKLLIKKDKQFYLSKNLKQRIFRRITNHQSYLFLKAIITFRKYNYYKEKNNILMSIYYGRKKNHIMQNHQLELAGQFGENLSISHLGIVINENAIIGNNVKLHGMNCLGANLNSNQAPKIGNNVDIGFGSSIIGNVILADNIIIGANSVVTKSFLEEGVVLAGCPAKIIKKIDK